MLLLARSMLLDWSVLLLLYHLETCSIWPRKEHFFQPLMQSFSVDFGLVSEAEVLLLPQNRKSILKTHQIPYFATGVSCPFYVRGVKQILISSQRCCCDYLGRNR